MKLFKLLALVFAGAMMIVAGAYYSGVFANGDIRMEKLVIESNGGASHAFEVEIAATPEAAETGLMFREHMQQDHGMLFELGQAGIVSFWMKNTLIPLDMLFIAPDGKIKKIHENAVPKSLDSISSEFPVSAVLELNGGRARALGIREGDKVIHGYFKAE